MPRFVLIQYSSSSSVFEADLHTLCRASIFRFCFFAPFFLFFLQCRQLPSLTVHSLTLTHTRTDTLVPCSIVRTSGIHRGQAERAPGSKYVPSLLRLPSMCLAANIECSISVHTRCYNAASCRPYVCGPCMLIHDFLDLSSSTNQSDSTTIL